MEPENKFAERLRIVKQALEEKSLGSTTTLSSSTRDNVERASALMELVLSQLGTAHRGMELVAQRGLSATVDEAVDASQQYFDTMRSCAQNINSLESRLGTVSTDNAPCTMEELVQWAATPLQKRLLEVMMTVIYDDHFCYVTGAVNGTNGSITLVNFIKLLGGEWRRATLQAVVDHMNARCAGGYLETFCAAVQKRMRLLLMGSCDVRNNDRAVEQFGDALKWFEQHCARDKVIQTRQYRVALVASVLLYLKSRDLKEDHERGNHEHAKKLLRLVHRIEPREMCFLSKDLEDYITELRKANRQGDDDRVVLERFIQWHDTPTKQPIDMSLEEFCDSLRDHADYITACSRFSIDSRAPRDLYFQYVESFDARYELCAECTHQSLHTILSKMTLMLKSLSCIKPERPLSLSERQKEQYLSLVSIFLTDIELSREGISEPCLCCGVAYKACIEKLLLGDQSPLGEHSRLIEIVHGEQYSHITHTLQQLRVLIRLPSIEQALWGDDVMNVEECGGGGRLDNVIDDEDSITIGHFDTEEEEEDTIVAEDEDNTI